MHAILGVTCRRRALGIWGMWGSVHSVTEGCSGICKSLCNGWKGMIKFVEAVRCGALYGGRKGAPGRLVTWYTIVHSKSLWVSDVRAEGS